MQELLKTKHSLSFSTSYNDTTKFWTYNGENDPVDIVSFRSKQLMSEPVFYNDKVYFEYFVQYKGGQLYSWDGSNKIKYVMDFKPGYWNAKIKKMFVAEGRLFFVLESSNHDISLWEMNKKEKPQLVFDKNSGLGKIIDLSQFYYSDDYLAFVVLDEGKKQVRLYDGTHSPCKIIDFNEGNFKTNPGNILIHKNTLYYTSNDGIHGSEWWCCPLDFFK